jgi:glycosyltransferase involved in cell wall biosynthesis
MVGSFGLHPNKTMSSRAFGLAHALVQRDHDVCLFMPPWQTPEEGDRRWQQEGVEFRYVPVTGGILGITRRLVQETLAWKPDIVHCFKPKAYSGLVAWWLWLFRRQKMKLVVDSDDWEGWGGWNDRAAYSPLQKRVFSWQERWGMSHCHQLTVASKALQSIAWSHGIAEEKVVYLPNGTGLSTRGLPIVEQEIAAKRHMLGIENRPVLLLYSRLFEFETSRLAKILAGVKTAVPDVAILSIGESLFANDALQLRDELADADVLSAVIDLGWTDVDKLPLLLSCADVAIYLMDDTLLNRTKCPVKLADLISLGVPVVAEAVGQVPEYVVNGRNGHLSVSGDIEELIDTCVSLLQNKAERILMAEEARIHYEANFSWDLLAARLLQTYECT